MSQSALCRAIAEHAGQLRDTSLALAMERGDFHLCPFSSLVLFDQIMTHTQGGDLGKMRDTEDLVPPGYLGQLFANDTTDLTANIGVDLIEDKDGDAIKVGKHGLEREHHASEFAAGGYAAEGQGSLTDVG